jgi:hypothetical protein
MSALTSNFVGSVETIERDLRPLAAGQVTYEGHICVANPGGSAAGYYGEATGAAGEIPVGRFYGQYGAVNNSAGSAGAAFADVQFFRERTLMLLNNSTTHALTAANRETDMYIQDAITVSTLNTLAKLGKFYDFSEDGSGLCWVEFPYPASI